MNLKKILFYFFITVCISVSCKNGIQVGTEELPIIQKALNDSSSNYYGFFSQYGQDLSDLPIGVFDSGTGGLTVLEKLITLDHYDNITGRREGDEIYDFAGESFIYFADMANMPYGRYEEEGRREYLEELAVKDALFLTGDRYYINAGEISPSGRKPRVKIIVIACNTATAYGYGHISRMLEKSNTGVKVIGVIPAGVRATFDALKAKQVKSPVAIGVLATPGTIASGAYQKEIEKVAKERGMDVTVVNQSGYGLAEAVDTDPDFVNRSLFAVRDSYRGPRIGKGEDSLDIDILNLYNFEFKDNDILYKQDGYGDYTDIQLNSAANYARFNLVSLIEKHRQSGSKVPLKAVILGCTHYPFVIETLNDVISEMRHKRVRGQYPYLDLIAEDFEFIDPALYTAIECYQTLRDDHNLALNIGATEASAYISVPSADLSPEFLAPDGGLTYDFKYGRITGSEIITTKAVPFSFSNIDEQTLLRIEQKLPYSYSLIYPTLH
ncbi:MAG: aspartate/glutamate racemase family protein [Bacteroidales bacterium]|nr:aspartate/glutamate racemase family protein [Bacteroidales bacterium]